MKIHKKYISILTAATFLALSFSAFAEEVPSGISGMSEYESSESVDDSGSEQNIEQSDFIKTDGDALESDSGTSGQNTEQNKEKDIIRKEKSGNQKFDETDNDNTEDKDEELKKDDENDKRDKHDKHIHHVYPDFNADRFTINESTSDMEVAANEVVNVELKDAGYVSVLDSCEKFVDVIYDGRSDDRYLYHFIMPDADVRVSAFNYGNMMDTYAMNAREIIGSQLTVTYQDYSRTELDQAGYVISTAYFELSNGHWAICSAHELLAPPAGTKMTVSQIYTAENQLNENIRKVLYYGIDGPGALGYSWSQTALAVSVANGHGDSYFKLGTKVLSEIVSKPSPPASFVVYYLSDGNNTTQDLVYWENKTVAYLQIQKQFAGNSSYSYNPNASPAIYGIYSDQACSKPYDSPYVDGNSYTYRIEADLMTGKIPVEPGVYYVKEIQAPNGWTVDSNIYTIDATKSFEAASPAKVTSTNIPEIELKTSARSIETAEHIAMAKPIKITDTVSYKWLKGNTQYTMKATAMNRTTGQPVKNQQGKATVTEKVFMSNASGVSGTGHGSVDVEILVDATGMETHDIVIFEELMLNGKLQASHKDLNDENQTVHIPGAKTSAQEENSGIKHAIAQKDMVITDIITYQNLIPGKSYKVSGVLMDKATGKTLKTPDNKDITVEKEFKPSEANGTVEVKFAFDGSQMAGKTIVVFEEVYFNNHLIAEHKDLQDDYQTIYIPDIGTSLVDEKSESQMAFAEKEMILTDTVTYKNLIPGKTYKIAGTLMNKTTGKPLEIDGKQVTSTVTFVTEKADGTAQVQFKFDGSQLKGQTIVAFETITMDGIEVAVHADLNDEAQTVRIPEIHTTAVNKETKTQEADEKENLQIEDKVSYQNLIPGNTYKISGFLVNQKTGEAVIEKGMKVIAEKTFVARQPEGEVVLTYNVSGKGFGGNAFVVYETLFEDNHRIAEHADVNDTNQTIRIVRHDTPTISRTPATGDMQPIEIAAGLLIAAATTITVIVIRKIRKRHQKIQL